MTEEEAHAARELGGCTCWTAIAPWHQGHCCFSAAIDLWSALLCGHEPPSLTARRHAELAAGKWPYIGEPVQLALFGGDAA